MNYTLEKDFGVTINCSRFPLNGVYPLGNNCQLIGQPKRQQPSLIFLSLPAPLAQKGSKRHIQNNCIGEGEDGHPIVGAAIMGLFFFITHKLRSPLK